MSAPHYRDETVQVFAGDCIDVLRGMPDASVDSVVTDPPYGLGFMGKEWDSDFQAADMPMRRNGAQDAVNAGASRQGGRQRAGVDYQRRMARDSRAFQSWCETWAVECLRVLKPGGHLLAFGGTRTSHRLACAIEDAGFEIRDSIAWLYGSGFPKSLNVGRAVDRRLCPAHSDDPDHECPAAPEADPWRGHGTALKPAFEPVVVARKPLAGTVAGTVLTYGTGALNVDACRIEGAKPDTTRGGNQLGSMNDDGWTPSQTGQRVVDDGRGRWPANVVLDESQAAALDQQSGTTQARIGKPRGADSGEGWGRTATGTEYDDLGGASRYFYTAKADTRERIRLDDTAHPTVKPLALMRWLIRLVTPPGGTCLDPFAGSGTTAEACILEGFQCVTIEKEPDYLPLIVQRVNRRRDPIAYTRTAGEDLGLFAFREGEGAL